MSPLFWPKHPGRPVGYAGGLGPDNVEAAVGVIGAESTYWIDMESRIREDDRFSLNLVEKVCVAVYGVR
jgi:phosphoribosylanthranilate isomerase